MSSRRRTWLAMAVGLAALIGGASGVTWSAFGSTTTNGSNSFTAKPDFRAPTALATIGARADGGGTPGQVRQGAGYYLYANVSDSGSPASGVQTVTADATSFDAQATVAALTTTGGPWIIGGTSYAYRTVQLTADTPLTTGATYGYSLTMTDVAGNSATTSGFTVTIAAPPTYQETVVADGPGAYWRFGEASGATTAVDVMGTANATYFYGYTLGVQGALVNDANTSLALATSGGVYAPDVVALRPTTQVSIEMWIKPSAFTPTQFLVTKNLDYFLYIDNGAVIFGYRTPGPVYLSVSSTAFTVDTWQHVVGTYDGSQMVIYRNGVAVATTPSSGAIGVVAGILDIGQYAQTGWYSGGMDELAVYTYALTPADVLGHYERGALAQP